MVLPNDECFVLGFDPGGKQGRGHFGWSICQVARGILEPPAAVQVGVAHDALEARESVLGALPDNATVLSAGIDAPLFWGNRGYRHVDEVLKRSLAAVANSVCHINGMRGACLIQGVVLAHHLRGRWPGLEITECHPRVLNHLLTLAGQDPWEQHLMANIRADPGGHKRDATRAAISAWAMVENLNDWIDIYPREPDPVHPYEPCADQLDEQPLAIGCRILVAYLLRHSTM